MSVENVAYPEHEHPHGIENTAENPYRIWACTECPYVFADEEIRRDIASGKGMHLCHARKYRKETRCESHLEPYMPEIKDKIAREGV